MTQQADTSAPFRRDLGIVAAASLVVGTMVGTGIFMFVSEVAGALPGPGWVLAAWIVGAVVAGCGALCLAELAAADPRTGGIYVYLVDAFGPLVGFLYGWCKFGIMRVASFAIPTLMFATFLLEVLGIDAGRAAALRQPIAIAAIVLITVVNVRGVRFGGGVQVALTVLKILALIGMLAVAAIFAAGMIDAEPVSLGAFDPPRGSLVAFALALVPVMWTYGGWDESPFVAEEVRDPERNLPRSVLGGLAIVAVLFVAANAAYLMLLSHGGLALSGELTATLAMERALGPGAGKVMAVVLMISTFGAANGMALTGARIAYAAGRDQRAFAWFAKTGTSTRTPVRALVIQAGLAILAIVLLGEPMVLLYFTGLAYWLFAGATAIALIVLRLRAPDRARPFRVWAYPATPILFAAGAAAMCLSVALSYPSNAAATLAILAVGAVAYALQRVRAPEP